MSSKSNPSNIILQSPPNIVVMSQKKNNKKKLNMFLVHDEEHLSRQVSSNEGYYHDVGESASVPFVWESQPGTPKVVRFRETSFPPLTPPPSYNYQNATPKNPLFTNAKNNKNSSKSTSLLKALLFPKKRNPRNNNNNNNNKGCVVVPPSPESPNSWSHSLSSSSSSLSWRPTSYSVPNSPMVRHPRKSGVTTQNEDLYYVNDSSLCFGNARSRGCYSSMFKKVLLGDVM
ncbi:hypothetical protein HN51_050344 [Arachis hypogaea]|uniref:Uncharacterized protein n=1 Tax=Arachis hypogaea TaxID=3818 RepID=A0A444YBQ1_ARAHY|nr:transcriptional regulator MIT1-like [Arachis ipaensis]XP_025668980.1 transcriptional regulator MIT1 [Arachis hypogaea]QHN92079.1 uncharacterized protein DS421_17g580550 [Arachis hypogaea]RYQ99343.1 hypothetical protein Ahy_B07g087277 [Arachis hypogaea]